jgi:hypothetical protein
MDGFIGGHWAYALNSNHTNDVLIDQVEDQ